MNLLPRGVAGDVVLLTILVTAVGAFFWFMRKLEKKGDV